MKTSLHFTLAAVAVVVAGLLLIAGCQKTETLTLQEPLPQGVEAPDSEAEAEAEADRNLSDGLDEALAELDIVG